MSAIDNLMRQPQADGKYHIPSSNSAEELFDQRVVETWNSPAIRVNMKDFIRDREHDGIYDSVEVQNDVAELERYHQNKIAISNFDAAEMAKDEEGVRALAEGNYYYTERGKAATAAEYILMEGIHSYGWLGENVDVVPATEYDDVFNGVDFIVIFRGETPDQDLYLGVDATSRTDPEFLNKKIEMVRKKMRKEGIYHVKYFHDKDLEDRQSIHHDLQKKNLLHTANNYIQEVDINIPAKKSLELPRIILGFSPELLGLMAHMMKKTSDKQANTPDQEMSIDLLDQARSQVSAQLEALIRVNVSSNFTFIKNGWSNQISQIVNNEHIDKRLQHIIGIYVKVLDKIETLFIQKTNGGLIKNNLNNGTRFSPLYDQHIDLVEKF